MAKRIELKDSGVIFDPEKHTYELNGNYLSGITQVIHNQLFPNEFNNIPQHILNAAAEYGTSVHQSCEDFDANWYNDGTQEVQDYIRLCQEHSLVHEASEYTVSDGKNWASNIDKVFRAGDDTFDLCDIKTYGVMSKEKLEKARWQLSLYSYLFQLQNTKAKVGKLFVIHLRNKVKKNGDIDHFANLIYVNPIAPELCKELLDADLAGDVFNNPYAIPKEISLQENHIRVLMQTKEAVEKELNSIKSNILREMESRNATTWATDTMRITRKLPTTRTSLNLIKLKEEHPEIDYEQYMRESTISSSLTIAV